MEIIIGTYEEFLVGFKLLVKKDKKYVLEQSFTNHGHNGSIRSIATSNKYLASGSVDEVIHLINIKHRVETGTLVSHTGTITALEFLRSAYLFSSSEDGNICIWNTKKWQCEKILRGHKGPITSINLHSSGKLLLSTSKDKTLRTWNLIKGRCAYIVNLKEIANQVLWSPSCIYFALVFENHIDIYDLSTGAIKHHIDQKILNFQKRINKIIFTDDSNIIICGDCQQMIIYNIDTKKVINRIEAHKNRIKDIVLVNPIDENDSQHDHIDQMQQDRDSNQNKWLVTTSSDGFIKIWSINLDNLDKQPNLICEVDSTCRPTCMAVWTSDTKYEKFDNFTVPTLNISNEELEACKTKLKAKKNKTIPAAANKIVDQISDNDDKNKKNMKRKRKIVPNDEEDSNEIDYEQTGNKNANLKGDNDQIDEDEDDDDEEAIQAMKNSSKTIKKMIKMNKRKKLKQNNDKLMTFKQRKQLLKQKQTINTFKGKKSNRQKFN